MPDEIQVSAGGESATAAAVQDKPSVAGQENGSPASPTVPSTEQEHRTPAPRDYAAELAAMEPRQRAQIISRLDPQWLRDHPWLHQFGQSQFDHGRNKGAQEAAARAQAEIDRQRLKAMDPVDLGEEVKRRMDAEDQWAPVMEQAKRQVWDDAYTQGYRTAFGELEVATRETRARLGITPDEWQTIVDGSQNTMQLLTQMVEHGATKRTKQALEAELAKIQKRQDREEAVEARTQERSPDVGGGSPPASDGDFLADFAAGKVTDWKRAKQLLGMT